MARRRESAILSGTTFSAADSHISCHPLLQARDGTRDRGQERTPHEAHEQESQVPAQLQVEQVLKEVDKVSDACYSSCGCGWQQRTRETC
jgi:hypothetical protein